MVKAYRTTVSRPDPEVESRSRGSSPVKTTKMSPEEMEDYFARIADRIPAQKPKKGIDIPMKTSDQKATTTKRRKPEKEAFLKSIAAGNTIAKTEKMWGMSINGLAYWVKKWGLVGITPGKARELLDGAPFAKPVQQPEDSEAQNASLADYEKKLAEWNKLEQELQQLKLENMNLKRELSNSKVTHESALKEYERVNSRRLELELLLGKWNENDIKSQELLLEITAERDLLGSRVKELEVLLAEMTEDRDNWKLTAEEAKQALIELQEEYQSQPDMVNHPSHYTAGGIETIDFIRAKLTPAEFIGYCKGNILKYVSRSNLKGGIEDLHKAGKYIEFATKEA